jgi:hypothetical protein
VPRQRAPNHFVQADQSCGVDECYLVPIPSPSNRRFVTVVVTGTSAADASFQNRPNARSTRSVAAAATPDSSAIDAVCASGRLSAGTSGSRSAIGASAGTRSGPIGRVFSPPATPEPTDVIRDPETSIKQGVKTACAWVVVARPAVSEENLQPPDSETAGRMARAGAEFQKWRRQAEAAEVEAAGEFSDPEWREVVSPDGVRCFATSARRAIESATAPSRCAPSDPVTTTAAAALIKTIPDDLSIPAFLKRGPAKS